MVRSPLLVLIDPPLRRTHGVFDGLETVGDVQHGIKGDVDDRAAAQGEHPELPCWSLTGLATIGGHLSVMGASSEDRPMASTHSVTRWLQQLKQGDRQVVQPFWERYFTRLVHLTRTWFPHKPTTAAASAEDAALDAFASFCRRAEENGFADLFDSDDLWQILVVLAFRKRCNQLQHEQRQRRRPAAGRVYVASALEQDSGEAGALFTNLLSRDSEPSLVVQAAEECRRLLPRTFSPSR
jgi:hypothetical protein